MIQIKEYWRTISFKAIFTVTRTSSVMYFFIGLGGIIIIYTICMFQIIANEREI